MLNFVKIKLKGVDGLGSKWGCKKIKIKEKGQRKQSLAVRCTKKEYHADCLYWRWKLGTSWNCLNFTNLYISSSDVLRERSGCVQSRAIKNFVFFKNFGVSLNNFCLPKNVLKISGTVGHTWLAIAFSDEMRSIKNNKNIVLHVIFFNCLYSIRTKTKTVCLSCFSV